jgi:peroxiredoxin Q/BCP
MLKEGDKAPDFRLKDQEEQTVSLKDFKGKNIILYFYPKDDTTGCTAEACNFRDELPEFRNLDAVILGVSPDSVESHMKFAAKYNLPFRLLSDEKKEVVQKYGVWQEKNNYGKKYMGVVRTTFLINPEGKISKIFNKVKVEGHNAELLEALKN